MTDLLRATWYVLTLRCEEADRLRAAPTDVPLSFHQRLAERLHTALCSSCRAARRNARTISSAIDSARDRISAPPADPLPPDARARIADALRQTVK